MRTRTNMCCRVVFVYDPTNTDGTSIPLGKQRLNPDHINYTPCSGIWQTVWLESTGREYITQLDIDAKADGKCKQPLCRNRTLF